MTILVLRQKAIDNLNDIWNYTYEKCFTNDFIRLVYTSFNLF